MKGLKEKLINDFREAFKKLMSAETKDTKDFIDLFYAFENTRYLGIKVILLEDIMLEVLQEN